MEAVKQGGDTERIRAPALRIIRWKMFTTAIFALFAVYGFYVTLFHAKWATVAMSLFLHFFSGFGVTAGAHRLWSHRSYKARWPLRLLLAAGHTISLQFSVLDWVRIHRVHHKYTDTDADPHDSRRGFFFSHVGWVVMDEHPEFKRRLAEIDASDLLKDPIIVYQHKYYWILVTVLSTFLPTWIPWYFWNEPPVTAFLVSHFRFIFTLNITFLVNSAAHIWGNHPYDKHISPTENPSVALFALGEGWHNYHHTFPWDYKAAELGNYGFNYTTWLIDLSHSLGLAYDLKFASNNVVHDRVRRTGGDTCIQNRGGGKTRNEEM